MRVTGYGAPSRGNGHAAGLAAAMGVVVFTLTGCGLGEPVVHGDDRKHPLRVLVGAGGGNLDIPDGVRPGDPWTASFGGFTPCVMTGEGPLTITDVTWAADPGLEPTSVETYVVTSDGATFAPYPAIIGSPTEPVSPESWGEIEKLEIREDVVGYEATIPCARFGHRTDPVDEFYLTLTTDGGGVMVRDLRFHYQTPEGKELILQSEWDMGMCGPEMPEEECPP
ncbi:hypothetical protein GCM10017772_13470 [Promicromonospora soli]|uniref:Uncharacterized protein n=2 Tax=Promicromonospora soli TaxID=2035533 RepID=A0A919FNI7_9MICO|nr:hypothetical protein GCM10017772_13470 [Promicromonospora soli]